MNQGWSNDQPAAWWQGGNCGPIRVLFPASHNRLIKTSVMKTTTFIIGILALIAMSCEELEPVAPVTLSEYIIGEWENEVYPMTFFFTFTPETYSITYSIDGHTFVSDPQEYFVNDETSEIEFIPSTFRENELGFDFLIHGVYAEMTSDDVMTWMRDNGKSSTFTRLSR